MPKKRGVDDAINTTVVDRKAFEEALRKLLQAPPTSKEKISQRIHSVGYRPLKRGPKRP
jgi:hypothetical protein